MGPRSGQPYVPGIVRTGRDAGGCGCGWESVGGDGDGGMPGVVLIMKAMIYVIFVGYWDFVLWNERGDCGLLFPDVSLRAMAI